MEKGEEVERRRGGGRGGGGGDNTKEWTGVDFASSIRAAVGKGLLQSHLLCPDDLQSNGID